MAEQRTVIWEWDEDRAPWLQLYEILRSRIERGEYPEKRKIPSLTKLEEEFGLVRNTIRKAIGRLIREQYVQAERGVGTTVRFREDWQPED